MMKSEREQRFRALLAAGVLSALCMIVLIQVASAQTVTNRVQRLSAQQIVALLSNNSTQASIPAEGQQDLVITIFYGADGSSLFATNDGFQDTGRWTVTQENLYCSSWVNLRQGQQTCSKVMSDGDIVHFVDSEKATEFVTRLVKGNAIQ
ncbi:MAG: hypothetical protein AAF220_04590 [Pseudomonadota bacterium]